MAILRIRWGPQFFRGYDFSRTHKYDNKILNMENKISDFVDGLYVKDGRLINGRPNSMMGIEKVSKMRQEVKRQKNIQEISEGIQRAKTLERFMDW